MFRNVIFIVLLLSSKTITAGVPEIMEQSGTTHMLNALPEQMASEFAMGVGQAGLDAGVVEEWKTLLLETFDAPTMIAAVSDALDRGLTEPQIVDLDQWFSMPLGQRITQIENDAMQPEFAERVAASVDSLLAEQRRVEFARQIEQAIEATDRMLDMARASQSAIFAGLAVDANEAALESVIAQQEQALIEARDEIERFILATLVATYRPLSDDELRKYVEFLQTPAALAFYRISQDAVLSDLSDKWEQLGKLLAQSTKQKLSQAAAGPN